MKQNLKDFLLNLIISMIIGIFVGITHFFIRDINANIVKELLIFPIIGGIIGTISRFAFMYMVAIKEKNEIIAYFLVFIIVGVISCTPSLYYYFIYNHNISMTELVSILIPAEFFGMSFCYYSYKRHLEFNEKLINKKKQLLIKNK